MTIKSDKWITAQCREPNYMRKKNGVWRPAYIAPDELERLREVSRHFGGDFNPNPLYRPITEEELIAWQPMISPFMPKQVREVTIERYATDMANNDHRLSLIPDATQHKKIVSYGLSSFGYDVTLSDEFKIFTNINSSMIDPLAMSDDCYVDFKGDFCIIPPNSYILGYTKERFKIDRDLMVICLGKSTYARCFTGDTKVALVDGTSASFEELAVRAKQGERFWGYSVNAVGNVVVAELTSPRKVGHEKVLEVVLDNGEIIRATPDHKFMLLDGSYVEAKDLQANTSLMPLYRTETRGYEMVFSGANVAPNHKVVEIREVGGTHDVYCLTVPEHGNFALEAGVFVKNCGAIVNVTPIEAGFCGQVVIEISNATPLPLKVHAHQGIAQFLFFQSDEECQTSYADRKGKYQGQSGITTARV